MNQLKITLFLIILLLASPFSGVGGEKATDAEKLAIVYKLYDGYKAKFASVVDISATRALNLQRSNAPVVFVDTRTAEEREVSTLPGAISRQAFLAEPGQYRDHTVIAYCTISYRSGLFTQDMLAAGATVLNLRGGILAWTLEGGPVFDQNGKTKRIHVYHDKWNFAPQGYETVSFPFWRLLF